MADNAVFANLRSARRHRTQTMAIEIPRATGIASAGAVKVNSFDRKLKRQEWQAQAYEHANEIGELGYVLTLMASTAAKGRLVAVEHDDTGQVVEPTKDDTGRAVVDGDRAKAQRVLQAFRGPDGDHRAMISAGAMHDQIAGEALLLGEPTEEGDAISWELVSILEIVEDAQTRKKTRRRSISQGGVLSVADKDAASQELDGENAYLSRYHRSDWAHSGDATSALRRNAAVCREVILWTQLLETTIKSRLNAGLLLVPEEVSFPPPEGVAEGDETDADRFLEMIVELVTAPVEDRRSAASLAPGVAQVPAEYIDKFKLLSLTDGTLDIQAILDARQNALRRLAAGLDVPLEVMEGIGSTNHWNAAGVDVDFVKKHVVPLGERLARFFTVSYFRRMLVLFEDMSDEVAERWSLAYDGAEILTRMDAAKSADSLHAAGLISDDARVEAHGFDPDEVRPSEQERDRRLVERIAAVPSVNNRPLLPAVIDFGQYPELDPGMLEQFLAPQTSAPAEPDPTAADPDESTPDGGPPVDTEPSADTPAAGDPNVEGAALAVLERIRTAGAIAVDKALQRAANRVVTQERRLPAETKSKLDQPHYRTGPRKPEVLRLLAPSDWKAIQLSPETLLRNEFTEFEQQSTLWFHELYSMTGRDPSAADGDARRAAGQLAAQLSALALQGFTRPLDREPGTGLTVPLATVAGVVNA